MKVIIDSDLLISLWYKDQPTHQKAKKIYSQIHKHNNSSIYILNLNIQESATVISKKYSQTEAVRFTREIEDNINKKLITYIKLTNKIESLAWQIFAKQTKKNISFIDCAVLATFQIYKFDKILSFDDFYPQRWGKAK